MSSLQHIKRPTILLFLFIYPLVCSRLLPSADAAEDLGRGPAPPVSASTSCALLFPQRRVKQLRPRLLFRKRSPSPPLLHCENTRRSTAATPVSLFFTRSGRSHTHGCGFHYTYSPLFVSLCCAWCIVGGRVLRLWLRAEFPNSGDIEKKHFCCRRK